MCATDDACRYDERCELGVCLRERRECRRDSDCNAAERCELGLCASGSR
jgi:hypothetical protein